MPRRCSRSRPLRGYLNTHTHKRESHSLAWLGVVWQGKAGTTQQGGGRRCCRKRFGHGTAPTCYTRPTRPNVDAAATGNTRPLTSPRPGHAAGAPPNVTSGVVLDRSRVARVESVNPSVTVSFPRDETAVMIPMERRAAGLVLAVGDRVMTRTVRRLLFVDYKLDVT